MDWILQEWATRHALYLMLLKFVLQVVILTGFIYIVYVRYIRRSHAEQMLKGLLVVLLMFVGLWWLAFILQLPMLEHIFAASIQILFIGLIVIFQPELRTAGHPVPRRAKGGVPDSGINRNGALSQ
jgi:DNA integrity scanning protein DisA with diadenylate cyclase activity